MKNFISKLKKANRIMELFYFITILAYWISYGFFCRSILSLAGIEDVLRIGLLIIMAIYGLIYTIFGCKKLFKNKKISFIFMTILTILFAVLFSVGSYYIDWLYQKVENLTVSDTSTYTTVLLALTDTDFQDSSTVGMITDEKDKTGYILPKELMSNENMNNDILYYNDYKSLLDALYNHEVDGIFLTKDFAVMFANEDYYPNIVSETKIIKEYSKEMKNDESELLVSTKSLTEPFTVLVLGVDSEATTGLDANAAFNGDTIMLVTFNPKTLSATMFSIPRDLYVPIINAYGRNIGYKKINSSAAYGTASTINTVENLTGIEIDYFVKVNFQGAIDLVNALGGIDVDVEAPDYDYYISRFGEGVLCESGADRTYTNMVCMNTGMQHLNGEQALAYARSRHAYLESDIARNRHQQQIIEAIAKKIVKTSSLGDFTNILNTISNNIATNMSTSQILSFYESLKGMLVNALNGDNFIEIEKMQLTYFTFNNIYGLSCLGYYQGSLNAITEAMKENLGIKKTETITSISYDYSVDYEQESNIIGKGIYSGGKVPDSSITNPVTNKPSSNTNQNNDDDDDKESHSNNNNSNNNSNNNNDSNTNNDNDSSSNEGEDQNDNDDGNDDTTPTTPVDDENKDEPTEKPTTPSEPTETPEDDESTSDEIQE